MFNGYSMESFAGKVRVNIDTLYEWMKVHENFSEAKKIGEGGSLLFWEKLGIDGASGKIEGFNATAYIFNKTNKFPNLYKRNNENRVEVNKEQDKLIVTLG